MSHSTPAMVEEHVNGQTVWVAVRARGADWSWLTPEEAVRIGRQWIEKYGSTPAQLEWIGRRRPLCRSGMAGVPAMVPEKRRSSP